MTQARRIGAAAVAAAAMLGMGLVAPTSAQARGRHTFARGPLFVRPYVGIGLGLGFGPYWGPGNPYLWGPWGSYWGPYPYAEAGPSLGAAMIAGMGAVDMNVKPNKAEVWVDGRYVAEARDLDGSPTYLWLKDGDHRIQVYKGGYVTFDERVNVRAGTRTQLKVRLEEGPSQPPAGRTAEAR